MKDKVKLRKEILARRKALSKEERKALSRKILQHFLESPFFSKARTIFLYASFGSEVETFELIGKAILRGKLIALPRTHLREKKLSFHRLYTLGELVPGPYGILEPPGTNLEIPLERADLVIVPGVAFDRRGYRLGYGGGFYDRLLSKTRVLKIALAFALQVLPKIPTKAHDIRVDYIFTEREVIFCQKPTSPDGRAPFFLPAQSGHLRTQAHNGAED